MRADSWSKSDPYYAYNGVEDFLNLAFNKELLPQNEIKQRRKENSWKFIYMAKHRGNS